MSRDAFGLGFDTSCIMCGDPNGYPCTSCGHGVRANRDRAPLSAPTPWPESKPMTAAEKRTIDDDDRAAFERDELREHYR